MQWGAFELPEIDDRLAGVFQDADADVRYEDLQARWNRIREHIRSAKRELAAWKVETRSIVDALEAQEQRVRTEVDHALAAHGLDGARIEEFKALNRQASLLESYKANLDQVRNKLVACEHSFEEQLVERQGLVDLQREAFDRVIETIATEFGAGFRSVASTTEIVGPSTTFLNISAKEGSHDGGTNWTTNIDPHRENCSITCAMTR